MTAVQEVSEVSASGAAARPRQLIVTVYGLYAREERDWLSVSSVVRLLADLGVEEPAVRSSISRLKRRGLLDARRVDGQAGYALSPAGLRILAEGDVRIFGRRRATATDGWLLVLFSVPEHERGKRHRLRAQLTRLGFGTAAPGVWIAPGHLHEETAGLLRRLELDGYVELFRGDHLAFGDLREKVARWWDLDQLQGLYADFLDRHRPVRARWARRRAPAPREAFADYVQMLTEWRRLPYLDPGLPLDLLPTDWNGVEAAELFTAIRRRLSPQAHRHAHALLAPGSGSR